MSTHAPAIKCPVNVLTLWQLGWPRTHICSCSYRCIKVTLLLIKSVPGSSTHGWSFTKLSI